MELTERAKIVSSLLRNFTVNICSVQIQWGFLNTLPFDNAGSWVSALSGATMGHLRSSELDHGENTHVFRHPIHNGILYMGWHNRMELLLFLLQEWA